MRRYQTNAGELDLMDEEGIVFKTYAQGAWLDVSRIKEDDEEWPRDLRPGYVDEDEEDDSEGNLTLPPFLVKGPFDE
jgi:hypothetical protein